MRLIHPIYLDVPMLVSFAAAIEGGVSFGSEITRERSSDSTVEAGGTARFGFSTLFSKFFDASAEATLTGERSEQDQSRETESKGHTEASIAILLYDRLTRGDGYILRPTQVEDIPKLDPGTLIELAGTVEKNAVDITIDLIDAIDILSSMATSSPPSTTAKHKSGAAAGPGSSLRSIRETLDRDRKRTPISNVLLRCTEPPDCTAVLTLRTENLRDLTMSELHKNNVRVVGKVTRVIPTGSSMSAFENYGMALVKPDILKGVFTQMSSNDSIVARFSEIEVSGPAVQVLPLIEVVLLFWTRKGLFLDGGRH